LAGQRPNLNRNGYLGIIDTFELKKRTGETGLEPAASAVTGRRYNQLNYSPRSEQNKIISVLTKVSRSLNIKFRLSPNP
jgi:hypothetical protein